KSSGNLNDGDDMTYDNSSRIESKRTNQWFMDSPEVDLVPNKKQAVEAPNSLSSGMLNSNISSWGNSLSFHSLTGHFTAQLFDPGAASMNFEDTNIFPLNIDNKLNAEEKDILDPFGGDASFGLSMSTTLEDSQLVFNHNGIRKVKVNEVKESENFMSVPTNNPYDGGVSKTVSNTHAFKEGDHSISTSLTYNKGDAN
ncbi:putative DNA-binding protein, partial [Trifolium medium]|nr:putative DNA-binding protein [Trifolium medium]